MPSSRSSSALFSVRISLLTQGRMQGPKVLVSQGPALLPPKLLFWGAAFVHGFFGCPISRFGPITVSGSSIRLKSMAANQRLLFGYCPKEVSTHRRKPRSQPMPICGSDQCLKVTVGIRMKTTIYYGTGVNGSWQRVRSVRTYFSSARAIICSLAIAFPMYYLSISHQTYATSTWVLAQTPSCRWRIWGLKTLSQRGAATGGPFRAEITMTARQSAETEAMSQLGLAAVAAT